MNKLALTLAALPTLAIGLLTGTDSAEARMRFGMGFGFGNNWAHQQVFSNRWPSERSRSEQYVEKRRYVKPSRRDDDDDKPRRIVKKQVEEKPEPKVVKQSKPEPEIKYADGLGRQYDLKSKVWFDGKATCYSGKNAFSFQGGHWYYGSAQWNLERGEWSTKSSTPPATVDCQSVPLFASRIEKVQTKVATVEPAAPPAEVKTVGKQVTTSTETPAPVKTSSAETIRPEAKEKTIKVDAKSTAKVEKQVKSVVAEVCKKYFPSVGTMLDVPCE